MASPESRAAPDPIRRLILELSRLPGIGERTATRLAFHLIREAHQSGAGPSLARDLAAALTAACDSVGLCSECQNLAVGGRCGICADTRRDRATLCIVEAVQDLRAIEATASFRGLYHVLHGAISPLDGIGPAELHITELLDRLGSLGAREVILATNHDVEGDATALYLAQKLRPLGLRVTRLASGIPLGGELEFIDQATLGRALAERREF
jgi:recombination protein RecR